MAKGKNRRQVVSDDSENEDRSYQESYDDLDERIDDETGEDDSEDDDFADPSFVHDSDDGDSGKRINYRELNQQLDNARYGGTSKSLARKRDADDMSGTQEEELASYIPTTYSAVAQEDPSIYRVRVRHGRAVECAYIMYRILEFQQTKIESNMDNTYQFKISAVIASPNDPDAVYIETNDRRDVETIASNRLVSKIVNPFVHKQTKQPNTKHWTYLSEIVQLDRENEQPILFDKEWHSDPDFSRGDYLIIQKAKKCKELEGQLCRVYQVDARARLLRVLTKTPYTSLTSNKKRTPHRITYEDYGQYQDKYFTEQRFEYHDYIQGLLVYQLSFDDVQQATIDQQIDKNQLEIQEQGSDETMATKQKNVSLSRLQVGDKVMLVDSGAHRALEGSVCVVTARPGEYRYVVRALRTETGQGTGIQLEVERFQLIKYVEVGKHVRVTSGRYEGYTGVVKDLQRDDTGNQTLLRAKIEVDCTGEMIYGQIFTDQLQETTQSFTGLERAELHGQNFQRHQLVQLNDGRKGLITFLTHNSALILTPENKEVSAKLANCAPLPYRRTYVNDGSAPPKTVGLHSSVRIKDEAREAGDVVQILKEQAVNILYVSAQGILRAVPATDTEQIKAGRMVEQQLGGNAAQVKGARVRLTGADYNGKIGVCIRQSRDKYCVKLNDREVYVPMRCVHFIDVLGAKDRANLITKDAIQSQVGFNDNMTQGWTQQSQFDIQSQAWGQTQQGEYGIVAQENSDNEQDAVGWQ